MAYTYGTELLFRAKLCNIENMENPSMDEIIKAVELYLKDEAHFIFLLGSAGTSRFHKESDIDLAVYFKTKPDFRKLAALQIKFFDHFNCECDLVSLNDSDPIFIRQVLETGREIFVEDRSFLNLWKSKQLSMYPDFKKSREVIEDSLLNRKKYV